MTKNQYENIVETTIKNESADKGGLDTVRDILKNLGIGFPKGDVKEITEALETEDFMGWEKCDVKGAEEALENGTPVIAITRDKVFVITGDEDATGISGRGVVSQEELKKMPGAQMYMYSGETTDDPGDYPAAPHFSFPMFIQNGTSEKYLAVSGGSVVLVTAPVALLGNNAKWQFVYQSGGNTCYIIPASDNSKRLCVDNNGTVYLENSGTAGNKAIRWEPLMPSSQGFNYYIRNYKKGTYLSGPSAPVMCVSPVLDSEWYIKDVAADNYGYPTTEGYVGTYYSLSHPAVDVVLPVGTPIYAFADGIVSYTQESYDSWVPDGPFDYPGHDGNSLASMGCAIAINHYNPNPSIHDGLYARSIYMHLLHGSSLQVGDPVRAGDLIGYSGNTGRSSIPHLHFALSVGSDTRMDPNYSAQGWDIRISELPNKDAVEDYLPNYQQ